MDQINFPHEKYCDVPIDEKVRELCLQFLTLGRMESNKLCFLQKTSQIKHNLQKVNEILNCCALLLETMYRTENQLKHTPRLTIQFRELEKHYIQSHKYVSYKYNIKYNIAPMDFPDNDVEHFIGIANLCVNDVELYECTRDFAGY